MGSIPTPVIHFQHRPIATMGQKVEVPSAQAVRAGASSGCGNRIVSSSGHSRPGLASSRSTSALRSLTGRSRGPVDLTPGATDSPQAVQGTKVGDASSAPGSVERSAAPLPSAFISRILL